ncbi:DUF4384 domain-containing protein [Desulfovibrio sp. OttesenSCG-928-G15]|nr:DUF4384 domain-containing protein [Desulfovibrio sp. OttesenSCG-928-G15]
MTHKFFPTLICFFQCCLMLGFASAAQCAPLVDSSFILAALGETEDRIAFRGGDSARELPLPALRAWFSGTEREAQRPACVAALVRSLTWPIEESTSSTDADVVFTITNAGEETHILLSVVNPNDASARFVLPGETEKARTYLDALARFSGLCRLEGAMAPRPEVIWTVHPYRPGNTLKANGITADGQIWNPAEVLTVGCKGRKVSYDGPALLRFSLRNASRQDLYVQLVNYTADGQVIQIFPPPQQAPALLPWGKELDMSAVSLELAEKEERVRLILSRVPLDMSGLTTPAPERASTGETPGKADPADWSTSELICTLP